MSLNQIDIYRKSSNDKLNIEHSCAICSNNCNMKVKDIIDLCKEYFDYNATTIEIVEKDSPYNTIIWTKLVGCCGKFKGEENSNFGDMTQQHRSKQPNKITLIVNYTQSV